MVALAHRSERARRMTSLIRSLRRARILEHQRDTLPRADADAEDAVAGFALAQLGCEREHVARAG